MSKSIDIGKENYTFGNLLGKEYSVKRERVINRIGDNLITRGSSYGAEILCSMTMPIIDLDFDSDYTEDCRNAIKRTKAMCARLVSFNWEYYDRQINTNLYRTKKGMRLIVSGRYEWDLDEAIDVMEDFDADPVYVMLCRQQGCYRARLTPKPGRVGIRSGTFQVATEEVGGDFRIGEGVAERLLAEYYSATRGYRTCSLIQRMGNNPEIAQFRELLKVHDERTGVHLHGYPLA